GRKTPARNRRESRTHVAPHAHKAAQSGTGRWTVTDSLRRQLSRPSHFVAHFVGLRSAPVLGRGNGRILSCTTCYSTRRLAAVCPRLLRPRTGALRCANPPTCLSQCVTPVTL